MSLVGDAEICRRFPAVEAEAFGDEASGVVADREGGQVVGQPYGPVEGADAFGGFGGVLGDVSRYRGFGEVA
ncbi:hypothetical protein GCM10009555_056930 [Acrocarpospora macrocephala]|uniref:Uncharacterized protein n=1 Tax=Acrocarpospora macrocephala TaxID=150177 RepID=A0A5M3WML4_9ACTN|nr:hypothetical protein Amac_020170 [Acrocarpospora macrocephala]